VSHQGKAWHLVGEQDNRPGWWIIACNETGEARGPIATDVLYREYGMKT